MSSDGLRHEGEMESPDRDSVYAALRQRGIRAIKVSERIRPIVRRGFAGLRRRDWAVAACVLAVAALALLAVPRAPETRLRPAAGASAPPPVSSQVVQAARPRPRRFLRLPEGIDFATFFRRPHEAYLAHYAMPGAVTSEPPSMTDEIARDLYDNIDAGIVIQEDDPAEVAELKRIVAGMKDDARKYLSVPDGVAKLGVWLEERQAMERSYRDQFVARVRSGSLSKREANEMFRAMGLREIE